MLGMEAGVILAKEVIIDALGTASLRFFSLRTNYNGLSLSEVVADVIVAM